MAEVDVKFSGITPSAINPTTATQFMGVQAGTSDVTFSTDQLNNAPFLSSIAAGTTALPAPPVVGVVTRIPAASRWSQTINVLDFGADPTGIGDSTVAIQAAINWTVANLPRAHVHLPRGNYLISAPIILPLGNASNITITGDGRATRITAAGNFNAGAGGWMFDCRPTSGGSSNRGPYIIEGIFFISPVSNLTTGCVAIWAAFNVAIRDCVFSAVFGVWIGFSNFMVTVTNCSFIGQPAVGGGVTPPYGSVGLTVNLLNQQQNFLGGGLSNYITVSNCNFTAWDTGFSGSTTLLLECRFEENVVGIKSGLTCDDLPTALSGVLSTAPISFPETISIYNCAGEANYIELYLPRNGATIINGLGIQTDVNSAIGGSGGTNLANLVWSAGTVTVTTRSLTLPTPPVVPATRIFPGATFNATTAGSSTTLTVNSISIGTLPVGVNVVKGVNVLMGTTITVTSKTFTGTVVSGSPTITSATAGTGPVPPDGTYITGVITATGASCLLTDTQITSGGGTTTLGLSANATASGAATFTYTFVPGTYTLSVPAIGGGATTMTGGLPDPIWTGPNPVTPSAGQQFSGRISGAFPTAFNGQFTCIQTGANTFTYPLAGDPGAVNGKTFTGTTTNASTQVTGCVAGTGPVPPNAAIILSGAGITPGTTVVSGGGTATLTLSAVATASGTTTFTYSVASVDISSAYGMYLGNITNAYINNVQTGGVFGIAAIYAPPGLSQWKGVVFDNVQALISAPLTVPVAWVLPPVGWRTAVYFRNCNNPANILTFNELPGQGGNNFNTAFIFSPIGTPTDGMEFTISDSRTPYTPTFAASGAGVGHTPGQVGDSTSISLTANVPNYVLGNMTIFNDTTNAVIGNVRVKSVVAGGSTINVPDVSGASINLDAGASSSWSNNDVILFRPLSNAGSPVTQGGGTFTVKLRYSGPQAAWIIA